MDRVSNWRQSVEIAASSGSPLDIHENDRMKGSTRAGYQIRSWPHCICTIPICISHIIPFCASLENSFSMKAHKSWTSDLTQRKAWRVLGHKPKSSTPCPQRTLWWASAAINKSNPPNSLPFSRNSRKDHPKWHQTSGWG